jgi:hypothetical protein
VSRDIRRGRIELDQGQAVIERSIRLARIFDDFDRAVPHGGHASRVADRHEWREPKRLPIVPAFGNHFRPNTGRIAE